MPRRGAPQGQGPCSLTPEPVWAGAVTAKVERSGSGSAAPQAGHSIFSLDLKTIFSNRLPQAEHRYSKMGMRIL